MRRDSGYSLAQQPIPAGEMQDQAAQLRKPETVEQLIRAARELEWGRRRCQGGKHWADNWASMRSALEEFGELKE